MSAGPQAWWELTSTARWFQGKGRGGVPTALTVLPALVDTPELVVRPHLLTVTYPDGDREDYQVWASLRPHPAPGAVVVGAEDGFAVADALTDPEALTAAARRLATPGVLTGGDHTLDVVVERPWPDGDLACTPLGVEQSNTSLRCGTSALVKVFRRIVPGANLDIERTRRLCRAGVAEVPALYGWLQLDPRTDLAMVTELLDQPVDGWATVTAAARDGVDVGELISSLAVALRHVHQALGPATARLDGDAVAERLLGRLDAAVDAAAVLEPWRDTLAACFEPLRGRTIDIQPIHGDFHLGQALATPQGWRIIDFEGEPLAAPADRGAPDSVWRDVAGLLRSLDYASTALDESQRPAWESRLRSQFLRAYCDCDSGPDLDLLTAYEVDKAAYEVVYETRNRPDWVPIPLGAVRRFADARGHSGPRGQES